MGTLKNTLIYESGLKIFDSSKPASLHIKYTPVNQCPPKKIIKPHIIPYGISLNETVDFTVFFNLILRLPNFG